MKNKYLLTVVLCFQTFFLTGQTIICAEHISKENILREEFLTAIKTYKNRTKSTLTKIYLVDFFQKNDLNKYRIISCLHPSAPLFRQPDCIVRLDSFSMVFLYTPDYRTPKDSLFLDILERKMSSFYYNQTMGYNWKTLTMDSNVRVAIPGSFTPSIIEYIFQEGRLVEITELRLPYNKMYYEDLHIHPNFFYNFGCRYFCPRCPVAKA